MAMAGAARTVMVSATMLSLGRLVGLGRAERRAVLVKVPPRVGATVRVTLACAPGARAPSAQVTLPAAKAQPVVADTKAKEPGSVSVVTTLVAVWVGCWLRAVRV